MRIDFEFFVKNKLYDERIFLHFKLYYYYFDLNIFLAKETRLWFVWLFRFTK